MADAKSCEENNNCLLKLIFWFEECVCQSYTWHTLLEMCVCHGIHGIHGSAAYAVIIDQLQFNSYNNDKPIFNLQISTLNSDMLFINMLN